jgi:hypothetical protein
MEVTETYIVGDVVKWCWSEIHRNTYIIIDINSNSVVLKQNFGMGLTLNGRIPISELSK